MMVGWMVKQKQTLKAQKMVSHTHQTVESVNSSKLAIEAAN